MNRRRDHLPWADDRRKANAWDKFLISILILTTVASIVGAMTV